MSKSNLEQINDLMSKLNNIEDELKNLRDNVGFDTQTNINLAINQCIYLRDKFWKIDKALESEVNGEVEN